MDYEGSRMLPGLFTPLDRHKRDIRLIRLSPAQSNDGRIQCDMQTHSLDSHPLYNALSYEWGSLEDRQVIQVNNYLVPIRKNLWRFLDRATRQSDVYNDLIWIDALCIDQSQNEERSHQVNLMAEIYQGAKLVIAWLGPATDASDLALDYLESFAKTLMSPRRLKVKEADAVLQLCSWSYWSRLWVLQELVLAEGCIMCIGERSVPINYLEALLGYAAITMSTVKDAAEEAPEVTTSRALLDSPAFSMLKQRRREPTQVSLLQRVLTCSNLECGDPKDKIYALLGISQSGDLMPDYDISMPGLFNKLLRKSHAFDSCKSLKEVCSICEQLAQAARIDRKDLFPSSNCESPNYTISESELVIYPLIHRPSSISLWWAQAYGHSKVQRLWVHETATECSQTLRAASLEGDEKVVQILINAGVDLNAQGRSSSNALCAASLGGHEKVVQMLIDAGADVNAQGGNYGNALRAASARGYEKVVQILINAGADVNAQGGLFENALQAASLGSHKKVVQMLLDAGARAPK